MGRLKLSTQIKMKTPAPDTPQFTPTVEARREYQQPLPPYTPSYASPNEWGVLPTFGLLMAVGYATLRYGFPALISGLQRAAASSSNAEALQGDLLKELIGDLAKTQREFISGIWEDSKRERAGDREATDSVIRRAMEIQEQAIKLQDATRQSLASMEHIFGQLHAAESRRESTMNGLQHSMTSLQADFNRFVAALENQADHR